MCSLKENDICNENILDNYSEIKSLRNSIKLNKQVSKMRQGQGKTLIQFLNSKDTDSQLRKGLIKARLTNIKK